MGANFKPTMSSISDMKPFRFWCQKVLPTVYDDSLSYYELLNKVVIYLNQTVDNVDLLNDNVTRLYDAYVLLEGYVNDYFNQEFPALVEEKLDEMAEDGTLTELITTYIDPYFDTKSAEIDAELDEFDARLNNFISAHSGLTGETILWSGIGAGQGFELTLTDDPRNYNYIDVHYKYRVTLNSIENAQFVNAIQRFTSDVFFDDNVVINVPNANDEQMYITHTVMFRNTSSAPWVYRIGIAQRVSWDGVASNPSISQEVDYEEGVTPTDFTGGCITKIVGVKQVADSEVIDARVGADGTIYPTLEDRLNTEINELKSQITTLTGIPVEVKLAMDTLFNNMALRNDSVYTDEFATIHAWATSIHVLSISALFTQGDNVIYDTDDLDDLRPYLTVTASFDNGTTSEISAYTLSGTLEEGLCTIMATYEGKNATFNVTVTHSPVPSEYRPLDYLSSNIDGSPSASKLTKTPFIKTDFPASDTDILNYTVKLVYECNFNSVTAIPFGGRNATGNTATRGCVVNLASDETVFNFGIKSGSTTLIRTALGYGITKDEKHTIEIKNGNISLDGTQVAQTDATSAVQLASYKWALFGRNNGGSYTVTTSGDALSPMIGKIYEFSVKDGNDDYVLNYVPSMRKSDSVYGMYDTVSDTFYTSANSYSFIGGND